MITSTTARQTRLLAELPPFRPVAVQLLRMVGNPEISFPQVAALLRTDSVMSLELLRVANSPLFPCRREIGSVLQALIFLGFDMVSAIVSTTAIRALVGGRNRRFTHACWRHSLATALICQRLSDSVGVSSERGYTAGLIHDVGQLALLRVFPEYEEIMSRAVENGEDLLRAEAEEFGMTHTEAGRWLLSQWGCPLELQNVTEFHEDPPTEYTLDGDLICLVHAASNLADQMKMSAFPLLEVPSLEEATARLSGVTRELIHREFEEMEEAVTMDLNAVEVSLV